MILDSITKQVWLTYIILEHSLFRWTKPFISHFAVEKEMLNHNKRDNLFNDDEVRSFCQDF